MNQTITYTAHDDVSGEFVPTTAKRRCVVVRRVNGEIGWVCGMFGKMAAAEKRAAELNLAAEKERASC